MEWLLAQKGLAIYLCLFSALVAGAFGLPIPEDLPLIAGGTLIHKGKASLLATALTCYIAILVGDWIIFMIGWRYGARLFRQPWFLRRFSPKRIRSLRRGLERRSVPMIFLARHLFYLRTVTFLMCGAVRMKPARFLVADAAAAAISMPAMLGMGYLASEHFSDAVAMTKNIKHSTALFGGILLFGLATGWLIQKRNPTPNGVPTRSCPEMEPNLSRVTSNHHEE
jgi:membrane protein DedA with SNARE-associated domain